jgi:hypothetical protein
MVLLSNLRGKRTSNLRLYELSGSPISNKGRGPWRTILLSFLGIANWVLSRQLYRHKKVFIPTKIFF